MTPEQKRRSAWLVRLSGTYAAIVAVIGAGFCTLFLAGSLLDRSLFERNPIQVQIGLLDAAFIAFAVYSIRGLLRSRR
ncbi:hypothetical protein [Phenylobacterium sp.]|uniref:hypothetical protein n=1 Tax=Phenylobacterium sp. TaxID=1871053 RepID=UPI0025D51701|nr:hypothetical protein [Phenylobacterium sp.]MBX3482799.1 hypothetical protein [Phenylobacterium sp.]MCW5759886.1 hypothetical protein [Phenylobacterium sp.]